MSILRASLMLLGAIALAAWPTPAAAQESAEVVLLNGAHRVSVEGFGPAMELQAGEYTPPSQTGDFYFVADRDAFYHPDIDAMGGAPSGSEPQAAAAVSGAAVASSAGAVASGAAGSAVQTTQETPSTQPTWRSVGAHAFDLIHGEKVYSCMAGKISESDARPSGSFGDAAADLQDPRIYKVQCMGWSESG